MDDFIVLLGVGWPSGLRRQVKALVSSEAWVQIPLQPVTMSVLFFCLAWDWVFVISLSAHLAQTVERWPFKPMVVGSIPTVGGFSLFVTVLLYHASAGLV